MEAFSNCSAAVFVTNVSPQTGLVREAAGAVRTPVRLHVKVSVHVSFVVSLEVEPFPTNLTAKWSVVQVHFVNVSSQAVG